MARWKFLGDMLALPSIGSTNFLQTADDTILRNHHLSNLKHGSGCVGTD